MKIKELLKEMAHGDQTELIGEDLRAAKNLKSKGLLRFDTQPKRNWHSGWVFLAQLTEKGLIEARKL